MTEKPTTSKGEFSADWLVQGVLAKLGDTFDRLTGRGWRPSSSLATSELIERLKNLLDAEVKNEGKKGTFVPHNIKLKMQWDKFSADSEESMAKLENELLTAAIDHINDKRYYTYAPLRIEVKPDYFTPGVQMLVSFEKFSGDEHEAAINVTVPGMKTSDLTPAEEERTAPANAIFIARFTLNDVSKEKKLVLLPGQRLSVGRTKENDLAIDHTSVSKIHASLTLNWHNEMIVADTGSTNGTFINDERISYGKTAKVERGDKVKFGAVEVEFEEPAENNVIDKTEAFQQDEIEKTVDENMSPIPQPVNDTSSTVQFNFNDAEEKTETDPA